MSDIPQPLDSVRPGRAEQSRVCTARLCLADSPGGTEQRAGGVAAFVQSFEGRLPGDVYCATRTRLAHQAHTRVDGRPHVPQQTRRISDKTASETVTCRRSRMDFARGRWERGENGHGCCQRVELGIGTRQQVALCSDRRVTRLCRHEAPHCIL